jgi:GT2 family glycosyltransferase
LAIVVTHNGRQWLRDCLVSLNTQTYPLLDVLVVDDASLDSRKPPPLKRIAKRHLRKRRWGYLRTARPLGFGGAINWALSRVRTDTDLLLFIHDDAALEPDAVERMVARMFDDESTAIVGPKIVAWDDPEVLEEVGMAVDRFGYPYKGLEENEIDLGQHDSSSEVFFVTSTCMLMRHDVFKDLRGWDARMRAFSEDLDLCWRARVAGYSVRVEPAAKARHAIALARGFRKSPFGPPRYYIRRNRLRTITKNAMGLRLLYLIPTYFLLSLAEMLGFVVLRQPREIGNLARGLVWNLAVAPQTFSERARVQRRRKVSDRVIGRHTVRQSTRMRSYAHHQADRLEQAWGRRSELFARPGSVVMSVARSLQGWPAFLLLAAVIAFLLGFRGVLFGPSVAVGELLPYPERATALLRTFVAPWRGVGLGQPAPNPPALFILGIFPILAAGATAFAQKLLVLGLGFVAAIGAYKLVASLVDRPSRIASATVYALGAVGYAGVREGSLGALVFGAATPFVLLSMMRLIGWMRPPSWNRGRAIARVALGSAISAAFVPGALIIFAVAAVMLAATRTFLDAGAKTLRGVYSSLIGIGAGFVLLLPWSLTWFSQGGPFDLLTSDATWRTYAASFADHGVASVVLGQTPDAPALYGLALPILGVMAVVVGEGARRRVALALWTVVVAIAWLTAAISGGWLRPIVASPTEAGVLASAAFAGLAGLAVGAFRLDLPRRGIGLLHALTLGGLAASVFLVAVGIGPAVWRGEWTPGRDSHVADSKTVIQVADVLSLESLNQGQFRALWVGEEWTSPEPTVARPISRYVLTGPRGQVLSDLFETRSGASTAELNRAIASIEQGATDKGGGLLGAFNIAYIVLERGPGTSRWLSQRDLGVIRSDPNENYLILRNERTLARAGVYEEVPSIVTALKENDPTRAHDVPAPLFEGLQDSPSRYTVPKTPASGVVFLAESHDDGWIATSGGFEQPRTDGGWGNAFDFASITPGEPLLIRYGRSVSQVVWLVAIALAWVVVLGAAFSRRSRGVARSSR